MTARMHRRAFLQGSAGLVVSLPILESLWPRSAAAQGAAPALKRFIGYCQPLGTFAEEFWPHAPGGSRYVYPEPNACEPGTKCRAKEFRTGDSAADWELTETSTILEPLLESHRAKLLLVENLENSIGNHSGYGALLSGASDNEAYDISLDQILAQELQPSTPFPSLHLGVRTSTKIGNRYTVAWRGPNRGIPAESNPRALYARIFSGVSSDPSAAQELLNRKLSVLDAATDQARTLRARISSEDQLRLEQYFDSLRDLEQRLSTLPVEGCQVPLEPIDDGNSTSERKGLEDVPRIAEAQIDLLAAAMACDLTRFATFQMAFEATNMTHPWLGVSGRWHDLSHNGASRVGWQDEMRGYVAISRWNAELITRLVDALEGFGAMDGTAILWTNTMNNAQIHNRHNLPVAIISDGTPFRGGRHVRVARGEHRTNDMLTTFTQAAGLSRPVGDASMNRRALTELFS